MSEPSVSERAEEFLQAVGDDPLHAWAAIDPDRLREQARRLDACSAEEREQLPLFGLLVGVKDNTATADLPTEYGSPIYAGHRPAADAELVRRMRAAGALIAGKTKLTEFAWMHPGDTLNPLDTARTPGGSSSGSAVAVAAGHVAVATGTQTAGSVNRPASYCGVVGYKASFGLVPTAGIKALGPSLDTAGLLGASVAEIRRVAGPQAGHLPGPPLEPRARPRLGFARTPLWDRVEPEAAHAIETAVAALAGDVEELELPEGFADLVTVQTLIQSVEAAHSLAPELATHPELLSRELREALQKGATCPPGAHGVAQRIRADRAPALIEWLGAYHAVLTPSTTGVPPPGLEFTGDPVFSRAWNLIGAPSVSLPLAWTGDGLPAGLQLVAAPGQDRCLLDVCERLDRTDRRPC